jgi:hypothetical protein
MSKLRLVLGLLLVACVALLAPSGRAQTNCQSSSYPSTINCNVIAVGSSAIFPSAAIAAVSPDPLRGNPALCGDRFWTGSATGLDARRTLTTPNIPGEGGTVWVAWDNDTNPTIICAYFSVDSIVGQRLFYGQGSGASGPTNNGQLSLATSVCTAAGGNKVAFVWDTATAGLPLAVYNALEGNNGQTSCVAAKNPVNFTTASTDVAPADALFVANQRVLAADTAATPDAATDAKSSLGYAGNPATCSNPGTPAFSSFSTASANSVCYTYVSGTPDPISGVNIPASAIVSEGALSMLPIINITNTSSGGFGDLFTNHGFTNVLSRNVAAGYAFSVFGTATLTRDLYTQGVGSGFPVVVAHYLAREPMSGSYTAWEWQVIRNKESALGGGTLSQETNLCAPTQSCYQGTIPSAACPTQAATAFPASSTCSNYASWGVSGFNALKTRVIGTGQMVSVSNTLCPTITSSCNVEDTFGYAFYSLGTFGGKSNIRYLQLDGIDGLYASYSTNNGAFPTVTGTQGTSATPGAAPADGCSGYFNGNGGTITSFSCNAYPFPTYANIRSGNYRVWSINRVVWYTGSFTNPNWTTLNPPAFWLSTADQAAPAPTAVIPDFLPYGYCANAGACPNNTAPTLTYPLEAFRSHYTVPGWSIGAPNNGITGAGFGGTENGGDVAGSIIGEQAEADSFGFFGNSFLAWIW